MLDLFPYFMMFGVFCFMAWLVSVESDMADKLKAEKSELIKLQEVRHEEIRILNDYLLESERIVKKQIDKINNLHKEINDRDKLIRELRDCYNQNDKCTIWECNCI